MSRLRRERPQWVFEVFIERSPLKYGPASLTEADATRQQTAAMTAASVNHRDSPGNGGQNIGFPIATDRHRYQNRSRPRGTSGQAAQGMAKLAAFRHDAAGTGREVFHAVDAGQVIDLLHHALLGQLAHGPGKIGRAAADASRQDGHGQGARRFPAVPATNGRRSRRNAGSRPAARPRRRPRSFPAPVPGGRCRRRCGPPAGAGTRARWPATGPAVPHPHGPRRNRWMARTW